MAVEVGQVIEGKYRITRLIGRGGMGAVYEGVNEFIDRRVAIKVLLPTEDATVSVRFEQEAKAAGRIGNDHILEVLDVGILPDQSRYMVTEFLDGEPLASRIEKLGRLDAPTVAHFAVQLLQGLEAAHRAGVIHRDLKPDNIFLLREKAGRADFVKIIDFGISKFSQLSGDALSMTKTGTMVGTPFYLSPEQARGKTGVDHRADIYAIGVILFEALTGRVPFHADNFNDLLFKIVLEEAPPIESFVSDLDPDFAAIVKKAMAREVDERYASASALREAIEQWASTKGVALNQPPRQVSFSDVARPSFTSSHGSSPSLSDSGSEGVPIKTVVGAPLPRTTSNPTPAAFGTTGAGAIPQVPWWSQTSGRIALGGGALLLVAGLVFAVTSGGSSDEGGPAQPELAQPEAAAQPDAGKSDEIRPTADPEFAAASAPAAPAPVADKKVEEPTPADDKKTEDKKTDDKKADDKPTAAKPSATAAKPTAAAPAPAPAPTTPAAKPAKKKYYYGY